jgi:hypothetical protein
MESLQIIKRATCFCRGSLLLYHLGLHLDEVTSLVDEGDASIKVVNTVTFL